MFGFRVDDGLLFHNQIANYRVVERRTVARTRQFIGVGKAKESLAALIDSVLRPGQTDGAQIFIAVNPANFSVNAHLQPRVGMGSDTNLDHIFQRPVGWGRRARSVGLLHFHLRSVAKDLDL